MLEERDAATGKTEAQYVWSPVYVDAMLLRDRDTDGDGDVTDAGGSERVYALHDANFNVTALTDASGNVIERYLYDPYGRRMVLDGDWSGDSDNQSDVGFVHGHQGLRYDAAVGLYDSRLRPYDPELGRFVSQDPLGYVDGANRYQGYGGSPGNYVDPMGLFGIAPPGAAPSTTVTLPALVGMGQNSEVVEFDEHEGVAETQDNIPSGVTGSEMDIGIVPDLTHNEDDWPLFWSWLYSAFIGDSLSLKVFGVRDMVSKIISSVETRRDMLNDDQVFITRLVIRAHGSTGSVTIGYVELDGVMVERKLKRGMIEPGHDDYDEKIVAHLKRLRPYLARDAELVLWSCYTGRDERFLQLLANLLGIEVVGTIVNTEVAIPNLLNPIGDYWNRRYPGMALPEVDKAIDHSKDECRSCGGR